MSPPPAPALEPRLQAAADLICAGPFLCAGVGRVPLHTDIGSDHALLPLWLLRGGRAGQVLLIEKTAGPLETARRAVQRSGLAGHAEVRLGDGLDGLCAPELESVSLTGMGQRTILGILTRGQATGRRPGALVVQPNDGAGLLRRWALEHGYHLTAERLAGGFWRYAVLRFERRPGPDPAYAGLPAAAARFGPHLLRGGHPLLLQELHAQHARLQPLARYARPEVLRDLAEVCEALAYLERRQS